MVVNKRVISLFFSICVIFTLMFQSVHSYTHLIADFFTNHSTIEKQDKIVAHHSDDCQICHFSLSPFTSLNADVLVFYSSKTYNVYQAYYKQLVYNAAFDFIALRGPPALINTNS